MKKMIIIFIFSIFIAGYGAGRDLSLTEAFELGKDNSYKLKKVLAEFDSSIDDFEAVKANRYPVLSLTAMASYKDEAPELEIDLPGMSFSRQFGYKETYQSDLRLTMPLYTGGKLSNAIKSADLAADLNNAVVMMTEDELYYNIRFAYLKLLLSEKMVDINHSSLKRSELIKEKAHSLYEAGLTDSIGLIEAEIAHLSSTTALLQAETKYNQLRIDLIVLLGLDMSEEINLINQLSEPSETNYHPPYIESENSRLKKAQTLIDIKRSAIDIAGTNYYPDLYLFAGYSYGKPNIDPFHDEFNDYYNVGVSLNWSFNLGGQNSSIIRSRQNQLKAAQYNYDYINDDLHRRAAVVNVDLSFAYDNYLTAKNKYELARQNYRLSEARFAGGTMTTNRLLEIETSLSQAEGYKNSALIKYYQIQSRLYFITGDLKLRKEL